MLSITKLQNPNSRRDQVSQFVAKSVSEDRRSVTWVVSDLRSKFEIQTLLLERQGYFEDLDVLRASELWRLFLRRIEPDFRLISSDLVRARVKDQLETMDLKLGLSADQAVCDFMDQMSPILFHPAGTEKLNEWFEENPESLNRWGTWYKIAEKFAALFVNEKRVAPHWIAPLLLRLLPEKINAESQFWTNDLIFDLGPELSQVEADLILLMSQFWNIEVLVPSPSFSDKYSFLLAPYENLKSSQKSSKLNSLPESAENHHAKTFRFSGMLGEIKHAVATVRAWLDQGILPEQILIAAPDIEVYWPVLSRYLGEEGIPFNKEVTTRLQSLPVIAEWLAILKLRSGQVTSGDLEQATYGQELTSFQGKSRYEDFHSIFSQLLDAEDLYRLEVIAKAFVQTIDPRESMSLDQFLGQALRLWTRTDLAETIEVFLKEILSQTEASLQMKFSTWIFYIERMLAKKEMRLQEARSDGVIVAPLLAGDSIYARRRIFMGLSESQLKNASSPVVLPKEILSFNRDYGFYLQYPETSQKSFELEWLAQILCDEDHFCFPMTHLNGSLESPSQFWMNLRISADGIESLHRLDLPAKTRWDQVQGQSAELIFRGRMTNSAEVAPAVQSIQVELGLSTEPALQLEKKPRLSASSFERFRDCPFIFVAEKIFQLKNPPAVDLDLDRRVKGTLAHALLERLLTPPVRWDWSAAELSILIEALRVELAVPLMEPAIWSGILSQHIQLALRFLQFEKSWQQEHPKSQNKSREKSFEFEFEGYQFTGKIDRIDGGTEPSADLVLLDYKMGESSVKTFGAWLKENTLQLGFYTWAIEKGFIAEFGGHRVVAAFYYVLKNLDRTQGFKLKEGPEGFYDLERRKAQIDEKQKATFFEQFEIELKSVLARLNEGRLAPVPRDFEVCETCNWRRLCRAPHLN